MDFVTLLAVYAALGGVGGLIALVINVGKTLGWVPDGSAATVSTGLNILGLAAVFALGVFKPGVDIGQVDASVQQFVDAATILFGLFVQLGGAKWVHSLVRGVPLVGKSYSPPGWDAGVSHG